MKNVKCEETGEYVLPVHYSDLLQKEKRIVREQYIREQGGRCFWCECPLDQEPPENITEKEINWKLFPKNFLDYPVHLQHDHQTDLTEGAVHAYCNAVMWQYYMR